MNLKDLVTPQTVIRDIRAGDKLLAFTLDGEVVRTSVRNILTHEVDEYLEVLTERTLLRVTVEHLHGVE